MKPSLETLYATTFRVRVAAGDTLDQAQSAALSAVHRAGLLDAAEIVHSLRPCPVDTAAERATDGTMAVAESAIRRAVGGHG